MAGEVALSMVSLAGAVVGGGISFAAQWVGQRLESKRQAAAVVEARRAERVTRLVEFLEAAQDAERLAVERGQATNLDDWRQRAAIALDRLWTAQKTVHLLCSAKVTEAAHGFARAVHNAVRKDEPDDEMWAQLRPSRRAFLDEARSDLDQLPA